MDADIPPVLPTIAADAPEAQVFMEMAADRGAPICGSHLLHLTQQHERTTDMLRSLVDSGRMVCTGVAPHAPKGHRGEPVWQLYDVAPDRKKRHPVRQLALLALAHLSRDATHPHAVRLRNVSRAGLEQALAKPCHWSVVRDHLAVLTWHEAAVRGETAQPRELAEIRETWEHWARG